MNMAARKKTSRGDRRYKDAEDAPSIVSEKRLTFFLPESTLRDLRMHAGFFQVQNATGDADLPESPSALVREAVEYWLDMFREKDTRLRPSAEWTERVKMMREAISRFH